MLCIVTNENLDESLFGFFYFHCLSASSSMAHGNFSQIAMKAQPHKQTLKPKEIFREAVIAVEIHFSGLAAADNLLEAILVIMFRNSKLWPSISLRQRRGKLLNR
jgi:hypothetical protein